MVARACGLFAASKIKIRRAKRHLDELEHEIAVYLRGRPFHAVIEHGATPDRQRLTFRVSASVPQELSGIIGDVIHNLRAALDLLACELVRLNGQSDDDVYFPFCDDPAYLDTMIKKKNMHRAAPDVVDIIKTLKPYRGGNIALRAIHDLDIRDKHQMLIPIGEAADFGGIKLGPDPVAITIGPNVRIGPVQDGFSPFDFQTDPFRKVGDEVPAKYKLTFAPLDPLGCSEVVPTLRSLAKLVGGILEAFETLGRAKLNPSLSP